MALTITPPTGEPVPLHDRRYMTEAEKLARWKAVGRCCTICGQPIEYVGPTVIWDHRVSLGLGGANDLENMEPNHVGACAEKKTRADMLAIRKANRLIKKNDPLREPSKHFGGWRKQT